MHQGLTIGDFSRITHLSVKMLRRYHEMGLLEPEAIDPYTGYRHYSLAQVPTAQVIRRFRELGMPLREIREVLATADPDARAALIGRHLVRLEDQLDRTRAAVTSLRRLLEPAVPPIEVELRVEPATTVAAVRATIDLDEANTWYGGAMDQIDRALRSAGLRPAGPAGGLYDNALFTEERGEAIVFVPVADPPDADRVHPLVIPAAELAVTVHRGPHDDIDVSYGALGTYVTEHALAVAGPVREYYLVGPRDTDDPDAWRTEIGSPVFRTAG
ncbi:MerR family transcriptional regulator [Actinoallomurus rhizosphaericola]|uniref:MerR family transcriptional regulator n=1 Tax=Actinoallomurus rhizosphaericola TaxID=2952536 RepID=UPI002093019A|nr:MerR family transcriptional regulator [Actinoallomurus rhizosphaericola]MCO5997023.1 MerR family transcriptional regulator [Actinoallomurus rhizosphaericola]